MDIIQTNPSDSKEPKYVEFIGCRGDIASCVVQIEGIIGCGLKLVAFKRACVLGTKKS